jgi:hypothetical protein
MDAHHAAAAGASRGRPLVRAASNPGVQLIAITPKQKLLQGSGQQSRKVPPPAASV